MKQIKNNILQENQNNDSIGNVIFGTQNTISTSIPTKAKENICLGNINKNASYHKMPQDHYLLMSQPLNPASH